MASEKVFKTEKLLGKSGEVDASVAFKGEVPVVGLYFSAHWCPPCRAFTPELAEWYKKFKETSPNSHNFEIVFVSSDRDQKSFDEYYLDMPWLALPYNLREEKAELSRKHKVSGIPTLIILNGKTGKVITADGRSIVSEDTHGKDFPWTPKSFGEVINGSLVGKDGETHWKDVKEKVVGIYFSAHWCGPCRGFTPELVKTYNKVRENGKSFEIIFVSSDKDEGAFKEYYDSMPWLAIPFGDEDNRKKSLSRMFDVSGIPTLVILENGSVITTKGRSEVSADPEGLNFPWIPKPVNPLTTHAGDLNDNPSIVYFVDETTTKDKVKAILEAVAVPHIASKPDSQVRFFYHLVDEDEDDLKTNLQKFANIDSSHNLLFIDIPSQRVYSTVADDDENSPKRLLEKYLDSSLKTRPLGN